MSRRTLVTGASGFIGRHVLQPLIEAGAEVHAVCRKRPEDDAALIQWHSVDLLDQNARRAMIQSVRPQVVLHLAWEARHDIFWTAPSNLDWVGASLDILCRSADAGADRFVGVGSCAEYSGDAVVCSEASTPLSPVTLYGNAKDACRRVAEEFTASRDLSFAWARLFLLYGAGESSGRLVPSIARRLMAGQPAPMSSGRAIRDYMDVRDAGAALAALALSGVTGPINIASGHSYSVREVAEKIARLAGNSELLQVGALPDRDEPARLAADISRLTEEVGYRDIRSLDTGLAQAIAHLRACVGGTNSKMNP